MLKKTRKENQSILDSSRDHEETTIFSPESQEPKLIGLKDEIPTKCINCEKIEECELLKRGLWQECQYVVRVI